MHKLVEAVRDAAYTIVGFGVLAVQRAQVQRREFAETISARFGTNRKQVEELIASFESRITKFDEAIEARIDEAVKTIGPKLPEQAEIRPQPGAQRGQVGPQAGPQPAEHRRLIPSSDVIVVPAGTGVVTFRGR